MDDAQREIDAEIGAEIDVLIKLAIKEDIGKGDITTNAVIPKAKKTRAQTRVKEAGIVCGIDVAKRVLEVYDSSVKFTIKKKDGSFVQKNDVIAEIEGSARSILCCERIMLNFLQKLSGIATAASRFAEKTSVYKVKILDTRKTTPGFRALEKYAVKTGGCANHRSGLHDMVLIKDNHLNIAGNFGKVMAKINKARKKINDTKDKINKCGEKINKGGEKINDAGGKINNATEKNLLVEVEVDSLPQLKELLSLNILPDWIMLDNMSYEEMEEGAKMIRERSSRIKIEASGGITLQNVAEVAKCGVDFISVGSALTLGAKPLNMAMDVFLKP